MSKMNHEKMGEKGECGKTSIGQEVGEGRQVPEMTIVKV
jgi:hypothetical protein